MPTRRNLHDSDFYAWSLEQAALLRAGRVEEADLAAIAEEIESMGKTEKRASRPGAAIRSVCRSPMRATKSPTSSPIIQA
jgi:hypothetical protein